MKPIYDTIGRGYAGKRTPDPRIAALIHTAPDVLDIGYRLVVAALS